MMDEPFYRHWFHGFDQYLADADAVSLDALMTHCGRACSESYSKQVYLDAWRASQTLNAFIMRLNEVFSEMEARCTSEDTVEIVYTRCACDLVKNGHVSSPKLCLCSLKSLRCNFEAVLGENSVECRMEQTILGGADRCRFTVKRK